MASRKFLLIDPAKPVVSDNGQTRERIQEALIALMVEGARINHDLVAERAGISRRTVYRYYADQPALREAVWQKLSPSGSLPTSLDQLLETLPEVFRIFDERATEMMVAMSSPEGRAIRNTMTERRAAAFRKVYGEATEQLPEPDRTQAIAVLQLLSSGLAWREMRDQWQLDGQQVAVTARWAIETLLADLARRGGARLAEDAIQ